MLLLFIVISIKFLVILPVHRYEKERKFCKEGHLLKQFFSFIQYKHLCINRSANSYYTASKIETPRVKLGARKVIQKHTEAGNLSTPVENYGWEKEETCSGSSTETVEFKHKPKLFPRQTCRHLESRFARDYMTQSKRSKDILSPIV